MRSIDCRSEQRQSFGGNDHARSLPNGCQRWCSSGAQRPRTLGVLRQCRVPEIMGFVRSEEAFAGYQRHLRAVAADDSGDATRRDRTLGLAQMWHRDLQRDFAVAASAHVEISGWDRPSRYPFLDAELLSLALTLPSSSPQREPNSSDAAEAAADGGKGALRQVARALEAPRRISERRKRAAQYGSRSAWGTSRAWDAKGWLRISVRIYNALKILSNEAGKQQEESRYHQANYVMSVPGASHSKVYCLLRSWRCEIACIIPPDEETARARAVSFAREVQLPLLEKSAPLGSGGYDMPALIEALKFARENLGVEVAACGHVCDLDLWGSFAAACDCADLRAYAPEWGSCPASQSSMRRIVHDGTVLQVRKFPDPSLVGCTITCPQEADLLLEILRSKCGPEATDDTDAGLVDCDFVSSPFLPCGVREASSVGVTLSAQQRGRPRSKASSRLNEFLERQSESLDGAARENADDAGLLGNQGPEDLAAAWRVSLDPDGNGQISFGRGLGGWGPVLSHGVTSGEEAGHIR
eukprot:Skav216204  [mRNA]  locus=scaffold238:135288:141510:- [translate_table: standard]